MLIFFHFNNSSGKLGNSFQDIRLIFYCIIRKGKTWCFCCTRTLNLLFLHLTTSIKISSLVKLAFAEEERSTPRIFFLEHKFHVISIMMHPFHWEMMSRKNVNILNENIKICFLLYLMPFISMVYIKYSTFTLYRKEFI